MFDGEYVYKVMLIVSFRKRVFCLMSRKGRGCNN